MTGWDQAVTRRLTSDVNGRQGIGMRQRHFRHAAEKCYTTYSIEGAK
jgi:hypothetical protein